MLSANASKPGFISSWRGNNFSITSPFNVYGLNSLSLSRRISYNKNKKTSIMR
jgi:hypothetical protein